MVFLGAVCTGMVCVLIGGCICPELLAIGTAAAWLFGGQSAGQ
jgi:hypothetical protein